MFDTFLLKNVSCSNCGHRIEDAQSKDFHRSMEVYKQGRSTRRDYGSTISVLKGGKYKGIIGCPKCHTYKDVKIIIKKGVYQGIEID